MSWLTDYNREITQIKKGKLAPVYFLYGSELFLQKQAVDAIRKGMAISFPNFNYIFLNGSDLTASELHNSLQGGSLFGNSNCIVVQHVKGLLPGVRELLFKYLKSPGRDHVLVLCANEMEYKNNFYKKLKNLCTTLMTTEPFENEIFDWISKQVGAMQRNITRDAVKELIRCKGTSLDAIYNELQKIDLYCPDGSEINKRTILDVTGFSKIFTPDDLLSQIGMRKLRQSVLIGKNLIENETSIVYLLVILHQYIWKLLCLKDKRFVVLPYYGKILKIFKSRQLSEMEASAANYSLKNLQTALQEILKADRRKKSTTCDDLSNMILTLNGIMAS